MMPHDEKISFDQRYAGVLLHISSLPSNWKVGDLGSDALRMVGELASMGVKVWQTLPINMTHADGSPYQCISAFAGNPDFISLEQLATQGLLESAEIQAFYASQSHDKTTLIALAYNRVSAKFKQDFQIFCQKEAHWLNDFALFLVLRKKFNQQSWHTWPDEFKHRHEETLNKTRSALAHEIAIIQFAQYVFFNQWHTLKTYAHSKNIYLFGDIPIFVAFDSAEVWANPHLFKLDEQNKMTVVAGVPPDYFSETGQRWGNPHYSWEKMAEDGFAWWVARLKMQNELFDLVRIDHFRGLESAWEIAATEETAMNGQWVLAPGDALLAAIIKQLPNIHLVAEDLGIITPEVDALRLKYNLPGMKILQFAFGGDDTNPYLPQNIDEKSVVYTGTHDNDTTLGWYAAADEQAKTHLQTLLGQETPAMPSALIEMALNTKAYLAIIPMQDILALGSECRMNTPGTIVNNWAWRLRWPQLTKGLIAQFNRQILQSGRSS